LWLRGYPDQAISVSQQAITLAEQLNHPFSMAHALNFGCTLNLSIGRTAGTQVEALIRLAGEHGFAEFLAVGTILRWSVARESDRGRIAIMHEALAALRAAKAVIVLPYSLVLVAQASKETGLVEEGLDALAEAFTIITDTAVPYVEAEMYRLKGELLLQRDGASAMAEACTCFQRAIEIAQNQRAKSRELRSTISLARLLDNQGLREEARAMLAKIYNWFTEGFDTADLKEAKALLEEWSP
jgi:predicted ATPase